MKVLCKCGTYARTRSDISVEATCGNCGRIWRRYCGSNENDWTMTHEPPALAALAAVTAERDRLAEALRLAADARVEGARAIAYAALAALNEAAK